MARTRSSIHTRAWVISWGRGSVQASQNEPGTPQGDPLAVLPSRASRERVEGALVTLFQMISGADPDLMVGHLRRTPAYTVEWDADGNIARIGHDVEVYAYRTEIHFDGTRRALVSSNGRGLLSYEQVKWVTQSERRERIKAEMAAGTYEWPAIFEESVETLSEGRGSIPSARTRAVSRESGDDYQS